MRPTRSYQPMLAMAAIAFSTSAMANAQYLFTKIHVPGSLGTWATGIENDDRIVGYYTTGSSAAPAYHGFLKTFHPHSFVYPLDDPSSNGYTVLLGIGGEVPVGAYQTSTGAYQGFTLSSFWNNVSVPDCSNTEVTGAANPGATEIVGTCWSLLPSTYAWYQVFPADPVILSVPESIRATAAAVNGSGQIVGNYVDSGGVGHGFLRDTNNTYTVVDYPGASASAAHGISDTGVITGDYYRNGHYHGFILKSGVYSTINYPKAENTYLGQINANGLFVGSYQTHKGEIFGFYAVPSAGPDVVAESKE
jgi:hypothetical protein